MRIEQMKAFLENQRDVIAAYLFGSYAKNKEGVLSDVDVAVLLDNRLSEPKRFNLRLELITKISAILGIKEAEKLDVIIMNDAPINLNYEIIKHGKILFAKDAGERIRMESKILSKYLDRRYYERRGLNQFLEKILERGEL